MAALNTVHMSIATAWTCSRQAVGRAVSQSVTALLVRPSTWASSPCPPPRSQNPTCQRSTSVVHDAVASSKLQRGLPRRTSSMPSTVTGSGSVGNTVAACTVNAAATTGQDRPRSRAVCTIVRLPSATAAPAAWRSRTVIRARAGTCGTCSVNDLRGHPGWSQCQRRLRHRSRAVRPAIGRSRGRVVVHCFTRTARNPHCGQHRACSSPVDRWTTGEPSGCSSTRSATRPSRPSNRVVSLTMLAALHL
jgi:hypothetical protein